MKLKQLFTDDSAVSPVIGVILMVAITVILAAVIGTFVLNLGGSVSQTTPQASFGFDFEEGSDTVGDNVTVTHETGATIDSDRLNLTATVDIDIADSTANVDPSAESSSEGFSEALGEGVSVGAGSTVYAGSGTDEELNGETIRVVWSSETGESSATLSEYTAPSN